MKKYLIIILLIIPFFGYSQAYNDIYARGIYLFVDPAASNNSILLQSPSLTSSITFTLPPSLGTNNYALTTLGNGSLTWTDPSSGSGGAAGNTGEIQFNDNGSFGASSNLFWDNTNNRLGINTNAPDYDLDVDGNIKVGSGNDNQLIIFSEQGATDYEVIFKAPDNLSADVTLRWPEEDGGANQLLITDGNGNLEWSDENTVSGNDCIGVGSDGGDEGGSNNSVTGQNGFIGGGENNSINVGSVDSFIGGGAGNSVSGDYSSVFVGENNTVNGDFSIIVSGENNTIEANYSIIFTGENNFIGSSGNYSMIGGGSDNAILSEYCAIGAGQSNTIGVNSDYSFIGAGQTNFIENSPYSSIVTGRDNSIITSASYSVIGAGDENTISGAYGFIGGGNNNYITGEYSVILSGESNTVSGDYAAIAGSEGNTAAGDYSLVIGRNSSANEDYSMAFGRNVIADHEGALVMGDGNTTSLSSSTTNQFSARFDGGYRLFTNNNVNAGSNLLGGNSSWTSISDSTLKTKILKLDPIENLNKFKKLDLYSWSYKGYEAKGIRNYGPMAQDFYRLFGKDKLGKIGSPKWISPYDFSSVSISALQGLHEKYLQNKAIIDKLEKENKSNKEKLEELKELYQELLELK